MTYVIIMGHDRFLNTDYLLSIRCISTAASDIYLRSTSWFIIATRNIGWPSGWKDQEQRVSWERSGSSRLFLDTRRRRVSSKRKPDRSWVRNLNLWVCSGALSMVEQDNGAGSGQAHLCSAVRCRTRGMLPRSWHGETQWLTVRSVHQHGR